MQMLLFHSFDLLQPFDKFVLENFLRKAVVSHHVIFIRFAVVKSINKHLTSFRSRFTARFACLKFSYYLILSDISLNDISSSTSLYTP